jgi:hypothetical protein
MEDKKKYEDHSAVKEPEKDIIDHCDSNEAFCSKIDPAGTDPNRYKNISSKPEEMQDDKEKDDDYNKEPKNHTTTEERLLNPDRGEKNK